MYNVPSAPHVNLRPINRGAKQKFWRPVPQSDHSVRVITLSPFLIEPCQTEVGEFQLSVAVNKDIGPLDITMDNTLVVEVR